jgi:hypothetical protein
VLHEGVHLGAERREDHEAQPRVLEHQRLEVVRDSARGVDADGGQLRSSCRPGAPAGTRVAASEQTRGQTPQSKARV